MIQNTLHDCRVFDAGDNLDGATAVAAGFDIDLEYSEPVSMAILAPNPQETVPLTTALQIV